MFALLIATLLTVGAASRAIPCGGLVNITDVQIAPKTMVPGEDATITLTLNNGYAPIVDGLFYYHINSDSTLYDPPQVDHLCDMIGCPIPFGVSKRRIHMIVPQFRGHADMRIEAARQPDMAALFCLHIETDADSFLRSMFRAIGTQIPLITAPLLIAPPSPIFAIAGPVETT
jgi:hypothetical protein